MKVTVDRELLGSAVASAIKSVPLKPLLPGLDHLFVKADSEGLVITASSLDLTLVTRLTTATVHDEGEVLLPGKRLAEILKHADGADVVLASSDVAASIESGKASWTLVTLPAASYPAQAEYPSQWSSVPAEVFHAAVAGVRHAAVADSIRKTLQMVDVTDSRARASDGTRMCQMGAYGVPDVQIPLKAADYLIRALAPGDVALSMAETSDRIFFDVGGEVFHVARLAASFPNVTELMLVPAVGSNTDEMQLDRDALIDVLKRVGVTAGERGAVTLSVTKNASLARVSSKDGQNTSVEEVPVVWKGTERSVTVALTHLLDVLKVYPAPLCSFFLGSNRPSTPPPLLAKDETSGFSAVINQIVEA